MAGMQIYFSIGLGVLLLIAALFSVNVESRLLRIRPVYRLNVWVKQRMGQLFSSKKPSSLFSLGMLNGLLPCGLVYMAVAGAVGTGTILKGSAYMALFGVGTIPLMFTTAVAGQFIPLNWRNRIRKLVPVFLVFFALLFIARGLNFDVPHEIRFWEYMQEDAPMCH
jgi:sulfite exporter TauE/SafE